MFNAMFAKIACGGAICAMLSACNSPTGADSPNQWKVSSVNDDGLIALEGKPFFPLCLYSCIGIDAGSATHKACRYTGGVAKEDTLKRMRTVKDAGFNALQTYTMQYYGAKASKPGWDVKDGLVEATNDERLRGGMLTFMDYAQEAGLKVMIGGSHPYCFEKPLPENGREEFLKSKLDANVIAWRNHPALMAWYLIDEPYNENEKTDMPVTDLLDVYRHMKSLDTTHPMLMASCDWAFPSGPSDTRYRKATDIIAPDVYPIGSKTPIAMIANRIDRLEEAQEGKPAMPLAWAVIQIWKANPPFPTTREIRAMALLALTKDVKGLLFFAHSNYPELQPEHWKNVGEAVNSLHTPLADILSPNTLFKDYEVGNQSIATIMRKLGDSKPGQTYYSLIAVNPVQDAELHPVDAGEVTFKFNRRDIPESATVIACDEDENGELKLGHNRKVPLFVNAKGECAFTDRFGNYASHVYRITLPDSH